jgi:D-glycero-alpha-D-manno-heptose-7-phosphate kinase
MNLQASAPTRVDLAGGTVDIWPLYLFHEGAVTVNFAIDLPARCRICPREDHRFVLRSIDTGEIAEFDGLGPLASTPRLKMLAKLTYFFAPARGLDMVTECTAPAGSGLAGSSALNIAICTALNALTGSRYDARTLIEIAKNVEAQVIDVPTGDQDFYPPTYGGVSAVHLTPRGVERVEIRVDLDRLAARLVLVFSGQQRNSGINNWEVQKRHIDGDQKVFAAFDGIVRASNRMVDALRAGDFEAIDGALEEEWSNRRQLADGISTPEIERIIARAKSLGAGAAKICGAGGGGCMVLTVPEGKRPAIESALRADGVQVMNYAIAPRGVVLEKSTA